MILQRMNDISISKKLYLVFGTMALLIIVELMTLRFAMGNLSALRAFVGGEASWSKAQKNAVYRFQRYAMTKNEADYLAFHEALKIPDGDRDARVELLKAKPNQEVVKAGFIRGHVHPDDIPPVINLLKRFYNVSYIQKAVVAWTEGDRLLIELREVVLKYHALLKEENGDQVALQGLLDRVIKINDELTKVEETFSQVLGEGSRWLERVVFVSLFFLVITVESFGLMLTFFTSRSISKRLTNLNRITTEFGYRNFSNRLKVNSKDEIGQLTHSINNMGDMLEKTYKELQLSYEGLDQKIQVRTRELADVAQENDRLYKEAKGAVKMRDDFLSIASHELRTPLTTLNLQMYLLEKVSRESVDGKIEAHKVVEISKRATSLVKKLANLQEVLMDLAQLRLGKLELKKVTGDFSATVSECLQHINEGLLRRGAQVSLEKNSDPIIGEFDEVRVSQVVTNLVMNAVKYGEGKPIRVIVKKEGKCAVVEVIDHGPGIPFAKQAQIFERFERANEDPAVSGLGLGLYISKQIVEAHGGQISVASHTGSGSKFTATFSL